MKNKKAYLWGILSKILPAAIQLGTNMLLARFLTPNDFGTIGILAIIFTVANVLVDSGLGGSLVKENSISKEDCSTIGHFNLVVSSILYICLYFLAPYIERYFEIENLTIIIRLLSLTFIIGALGLVSKSLLIRELRFDALCVISIASITIASIVAIVMAIYKCGIYSLVTFHLVNSLVSTIISINISKYSLSFKFYRESFHKLFSFGIFTTISSVIDTIYENLITTLTGKFLNVSQAGYLTQAKKLEEGMSSSVVLTIANVSFPVMTRLKDDIVKFKSEAFLLMRIIIWLLFPILFVSIIFSEHIIVLLFGEQWLPASSYFSLLLFAGLLLIIETLLRTLIKSLCAVKQLMYITLIKRILGIVLIIICSLINNEWIILGYIISCALGVIMNAYLYAKIINCQIFDIIYSIIKLMIPSLMLFVVLIFFYCSISSIRVLLLLNILLVAVYYLLVYCNIKKSSIL